MSIEECTIGKLKGYRFFVPAYQRGYRWTQDNVKALLDDIDEFSSEEDKKYCIQPLIVKRREDGSFEVVDGQQRLTTLYIFMKIAEEKTEYIPFELNYETRENSGEFLSNLLPKGEICHENIDFYHITVARSTINEWLDKKEIRYIAINDLFKKIIQSVFFIWYELPDYSDPIAMFSKVNLGKIPLTNAEIIKALLLNKENFSSEIDKRQSEISIAWDRIEQGLRDDSFWYFLNEKDTDTRIDLLFRLLADDLTFGQSNAQVSPNPYYPYLVLSEKIANAPDKEKAVKDIWEKIEQLYEEFYSWYVDLNKYHIIGFLITSGKSINNIRTIVKEKRRIEIEQALKKETELIYNNIVGKNKLIDIVYSSRLTKNIRQLLLLFNIATLVCKSEKQYRFPFDLYKKDKWDIEHIHATADDSADSDDSLWNLTLLSKTINSSFKNMPYKEKREKFIEHESKGLFIPLCTKNVFFKVYSTDFKNMDDWNDHDKEKYIESMNEVFDEFFEKEISNE